MLRLLIRDWRRTDIILFHAMSVPWILPLRFVRALLLGKGPLLAMDTRTLFMPPASRLRWKDRLRRSCGSGFERLANRWADGRLAITRRMAEAVGIPARKLWGVWPSGVDPELFGLAREARAWPGPGEPVVLIYVGVLHCERNLMNLCRAVEQAHDEGLSFRLMLVGDGSERQELECFAAGSQRRIQVVRPVPHERVWEWLARAHVGVLPFPDELKFRVSSPIKQFEYMAAGLPMLATRIPCHTDVVGDGGYVFWTEDAGLEGLLQGLRQIHTRRQRLREMGEEAAGCAEDYSWLAAARQLGKALERGLALSRRHSRGSSGSGWRPLEGAERTTTT
jgi:glycosyltransferase involved in cell wall biosynthesis